MLGIFLDLETTGLDPKRHCVLELALQVLDLSNGQLKAQYETVIQQSSERWQNRDPASVKVNGFNWERVQQGQEEAQVANEVAELLNALAIRRGNSFFICQNPAFDRAFFAQLVAPYDQEEWQWPYHWLDFASMYWALALREARQRGQKLPDDFSLSKDAIAKRIGLPAEEKPHRAMNGVRHLIACYQAAVGWTPSL